MTTLRRFITLLEKQGELIRIDTPVDSHLEITEISRRVLAAGGPALLFTQIKYNRACGESPTPQTVKVEQRDRHGNNQIHRIPVLTNLFGTVRRIAQAIGHTPETLTSLGETLASLRTPTPPRSAHDFWRLARSLHRMRYTSVKPVHIRRAPSQQIILRDHAVDLTRLPIQHCWPGDVAPLITWPLVITEGPDGGPINIGVYRMQLLGKNRLIMRWLQHRGGAQHAREHQQRQLRKMPVAVAIGADPALMLAAVAPVPETLSEYAFAGLIGMRRIPVVNGITVPLPVPADAEIILEGDVSLTTLAHEGPFGDHTGYYNEVESFPVFTVRCVTMRRHPIYLSTFTGRPPDEPAILALGLNRLFTPFLKQQFPEITDFHLPMEACSYRVAVVAINKQYAGHAFRVATAIWGSLRQFLYTKYIIVVDADVPTDNWHAVLKAMGDHLDVRRGLQIFNSTPMDYLDFASPQSGLGSKMSIDATRPLSPESTLSENLSSNNVLTDHHIDAIQKLPAVRALHPIPESRMVVVLQSDQQKPETTIQQIWTTVPPGKGADYLWLVDREIQPNSMADLLWALASRTDPAEDITIDAQHNRFAINATWKTAPLTNRTCGESPTPTTMKVEKRDFHGNRKWGMPIQMNSDIVERVSQQWDAYGLPPLETDPFHHLS